MKNLIQKVCSHGKKITVKLKRHHKKFLFGALCCGFLALIGMLFFSKSKADSILDFLDPTGLGQGFYGYNGIDTLTIKNITNSYVDIESPIVRSGTHDITSYLFVASTGRSQRNPVAYWCFDSVATSGNKFIVGLTTSFLDPSGIYYIYATPVDSAITGEYNGSCSARDANDFLSLAYSVGNDSTINGLDPCFIIEDSFHGEGEECENHKNSGLTNTYTIYGVSHVYDGQYITITWNSYSNVDIDIFFRDETRGAFVALGSVNSEQRSFTFEKRYNGDHIIKLRPSDGSQEINYTAHLTNTENLGLATGMSITLNPGWNVVSTPALLSDISFSNGGNGISFSKLQSGLWISVLPNADSFKPLEGFLAKNSTNSDISMFLTYENTTPNQDMFQKNVTRGWNLLGVTTIDRPFYSVNPGLHLDFTKNNGSNFLNGINVSYLSKIGDVEYPEIGEAYGVFLSSDGLYGGSNNRYGGEKNLYNYNDYTGVIKVTPGSYNIPLLKGKITTDGPVSIKNDGFYLEISGANANEDILGYEAGGIIYDLIVRVGSCVTHVNRYYYTLQTDDYGYKKIFIPLFENCNTVPSGTHDISVLVGINSEYATNFKSGMTITMNSIDRFNFYNATLYGKINSSIIEVSHDNLPNLIAQRSDDQVRIDITPNSGGNNFLLGSLDLYTEESGMYASVLFDFDRSINYSFFNKVYVYMYINGEFVSKTGYSYRMINYEIPLLQNENTHVEFRGVLTDYGNGAFIPKMLINRIVLNDVSYITYNCAYYRGRCTQFNGGDYIFHGGLFNITGGISENKGCTAEELLACTVSDDFDACFEDCNERANLYMPTELCTVDQLQECVTSDDYESCMSYCANNPIPVNH